MLKGLCKDFQTARRIQLGFSELFDGTLSSEIAIEAICLKLLWVLLARLTGYDIDLKRLDNVVIVPSKRFSLKDTSSITRTVDSMRKKCPSLDWDESQWFRSEFMSDGFLESIRGKYWSISTWENSVGFTSDMVFYHFTDFFEKLKEDGEGIVTPENYEIFKSLLFGFISDFLPDEIVEDVVEYLLSKKRELFFESPYKDNPQLEVYKENFEFDTAETVVNFLRFPEAEHDPEVNKKSMGASVKGFRKRFSLGQEMSDSEVYLCFKALYDQPLMVEFCDMTYCRPVEYSILKSQSLGFFICHKNDWKDCFNLPEELQTELTSFYSMLPDSDIVFPYAHVNSRQVCDIYFTERIYICGLYTSIFSSEGYGPDIGGNLLKPSLSDFMLLKWSDELYDAIQKYTDVNTKGE